MEQPRYLLVGKIRRPHGVKGEVRVELYTDWAEDILKKEYLYLSASEEELNPKKVAIISARFHQEHALLKFDDYPDRTSVEGLRNHFLWIPIEEAGDLEEDEFYLYQLIDIEVYTETDRLIGRLVEILETKANLVYRIEGDDGELLYPAVEEFILSIDFDLNRMVVKLLPGLLDQ